MEFLYDGVIALVVRTLTFEGVKTVAERVNNDKLALFKVKLTTLRTTKIGRITPNSE